MESGEVRGEEYELTSPTLNQQPIAGPSRTPHRNGKRRELAIHPTRSTTSVLFNAESPTHGPSRRVGTPPQSPISIKNRNYRAHFLEEDGIAVPDIGGILGIHEDEDRFAIAAGMASLWKKRLYLLMEEPSSSREAFYIHFAVTAAILFSCVLTTLSTLPTFHIDSSSARTLFGLDITLVLLFTVEYIARFLAHSDSWRQIWNWSTSFFAIIDLFSILPFYIEIALKDDTAIQFRWSILRVFRLLRVFSAFKYDNQMLLTIEVMYVAIQRSRDALLALTFFIFLVLLLFSTLIYFAERGVWDSSLGTFVDVNGDPSQFDSIPSAAWYALVTMSTVGYGDIVATSALGKLFTFPLLLFGLLLIALPSFVLGRNFAQAFDELKIVRDARMEILTPPGRLSLNDEDLPMPIPGQSSPGQPLLSSEVNTLPPSDPIKRRTSPLAPVGMTASGSNTSIRASRMRMWDGQDFAKDRDLTNIKLAKNQMVLLDQIETMSRTIDQQGALLQQLLEAVQNIKKDIQYERDVVPPSSAHGPGY